MDTKNYKTIPCFIVYINFWFSKSFNIVFLHINGITLLSMPNKIIQLNILVNIMSP